MTGVTPPLARNSLLAALLYSGRPASIKPGTQYWGGNGRPGRPYGYGSEFLLQTVTTSPVAMRYSGLPNPSWKRSTYQGFNLGRLDQPSARNVNLAFD